MKKLIVVLGCSFFLFSLTKVNLSNSVTLDVKIGKQVWLKENLSVTTYRNGDQIPQAKTSEEWEAAYKSKKGAWCYYDNSDDNGKKYGKLYNWYAVSDSRGLAPAGWHVPSEKEWTALMSSFKNVEFVGDLLKEKTGWNRDGNGSNESGFSALPAGFRYYHGGFSGLGNNTYYWTSTEVKAGVAVCRSLTSADGEFYFAEDDMGQGFSVRCVKD